ncbi:Transmembrane protease serine 5 [Sparganum proliferum]
MSLQCCDVVTILPLLLLLLFHERYVFCNTQDCKAKDLVSGKSGVVESHALYGTQPYPSNAFCIHKIVVDPHYDIVFTVEEMDIETSNQCIFDYLDVHSADGKEQQRLCGNEVPGYPIVIHSSSADVEFASDGSGNARGFRLSWEARERPRFASGDGNSACGKAPPRLLSLNQRRRIIGGEKVAAGQWPWLVSLWRGSKFMCGASLLNRQWVLTAAHCFRGSSAGDNSWVAVVGDFNLEWDDGEEHVIPIAEIDIHPKFEQRQAFDFDAALLRLAQPVNYSYAVQPVCLPVAGFNPPTTARPAGAGTTVRTKRSAIPVEPVPAMPAAADDDDEEEDAPVPAGSRLARKRPRELLRYRRSAEPAASDHMACIVAGWGKTEDQSVSPTVRDLVVPVLDVEVCNKSAAYSGHVTDAMLCAGHLEGGKDACQGDSGGPLMCRKATEDSWTLVGIVSFGKGCAEAGVPGIYSRVTSVINWIKKYTND